MEIKDKNVHDKYLTFLNTKKIQEPSCVGKNNKPSFLLQQFIQHFTELHTEKKIKKVPNYVMCMFFYLTQHIFDGSETESLYEKLVQKKLNDDQSKFLKELFKKVHSKKEDLGVSLYFTGTPPGFVKLNDPDLQEMLNKEKIPKQIFDYIKSEWRKTGLTEFFGKSESVVIFYLKSMSSVCDNEQDVFYLEKPFAEYTIDDALDHPFVNVNGKCASCTYLASTLVNNGNKDIYLIGSINPRMYSLVAKGITATLVRGGLEAQQEVIDYIKVVNKTTGKNMLTSEMKEKVKNGFKLVAPLSSNELYTFYMDILVRGEKDKNKEIIVDIVKYTCSSFINLIGLLGWICFSDDLKSIGTSEAGSQYHISSYCIQKLYSLISDLKEIKIDGNVSLYDSIKRLKYGRNSIQDLVDSVSTTCIHGVGSMFLSFYVQAKLEISLYIDEIKDHGCCPPELNLEVFKQFPPFLVPISHPKVAFLFATKYDDYRSGVSVNETDNLNPMRARFKLRGLDKNGGVYDIGEINEGHMYRKNPTYNDFDGFLSYSRVADNPSSMFFPRRDTGTIIPQAVFSILKSEEGKKTLKQLCLTADIYQCRRRVMFKAYHDYCLYLTRIMTNNFSKKVSNVMKQDRDDLITLTTEPGAPSLVSVVHIPSKKNIINAVANNDKEFNVTKFEVSKGTGGTFYIDTFSTIGQLHYTLDENKNAIVVDPYGRRDITRTYEQIRLINLVNEIPIPEANFQRFESYFTKLYGQATSLDIFDDIKSKYKIPVLQGITIDNMKKICQEILDKNYDKRAIAEIADAAFSYLISLSVYLYRYWENRGAGVQPNYKLVLKDIYTQLLVQNARRKQTKNITQSYIDYIKPLYFTNMLNYVMFWEGSQSFASYKYHFTQFEQDVSLYLSSARANIYNTSNKNASFVMRTEPHKQLLIFQNSLRVLNNTLSYFKENKDLQLTMEDYQESIPFRFEFLVKCDIVVQHKILCSYYANFESIYKMQVRKNKTFIEMINNGDKNVQVFLASFF